MGLVLGPDYKPQKSYLGRKTVSYGTAGSVRPDFVSKDGSVTREVKNYNLATNSSGLIASVAKQAIARAVHLKAGAVQVAIDTTGQHVTEAQKAIIEKAINQKTRGIVASDRVRFFIRPSGP